MGHHWIATDSISQFFVFFKVKGCSRLPLKRQKDKVFQSGYIFPAPRVVFHHVHQNTAYSLSPIHYGTSNPGIQQQSTKMHNIFSQFLTVNTLRGNKGCNDFPRACTCLIIQKKIDSGTMVWNTKICKRSKLWGKATKEEKRLRWEEYTGADSDLLVYLSFSIYLCMRRKDCEVTE